MKKRLQQRLIFLLSLVLILAVFYFSRDTLLTRLTSKPKLPFADFTAEKITTVTITDGITTVNIIKKDGQWAVKQESLYPADQNRINDIINRIKNTSLQEIASNNKNKHAEFGIGEKKIILEIPNKKMSIFLGKTTGSRQYLRLNEESQVFLTYQLDDIFYPLEYRQLTIPLFQKIEAVNKVILTFSGNQLNLTKSNKQWQINQKKAKKEQVDFFLTDLQSLKADDMKERLSNQSFNSPILSIEIDQENSTSRVDFYQLQEDEKIAAIASGQRYIYLFSPSTIESLKKDAAYFQE